MPFLEFPIEKNTLIPLKLPKVRKFMFQKNILLNPLRYNNPNNEATGHHTHKNHTPKRKHTCTGTQTEHTQTHTYIKVSVHQIIIVPSRSFIGFYFR